MEHGENKKAERQKGKRVLEKPVRLMKRHKKVLHGEMSGDVGSRAKAMRNESYSESYIDSGHITRTKSFKLLAEKMLPDELLLDRNVWLLKHKAWGAVASGLDKGYKAKHIYTNGTTINNKYSFLTREELERDVAGRIGRNGGNARRAREA